jgi:hypothetical protein
MGNKIVVEIEALDYKINVRDVAEALKSYYPNMPTVVIEFKAVPDKDTIDQYWREVEEIKIVTK